MEPENQVLETIEESNVLEQKEEPTLPEIDIETECPRCNGIMELNSKFDRLAYFCEDCNFILRCV
jgi:hypothetical protein